MASQHLDIFASPPDEPCTARLQSLVMSITERDFDVLRGLDQRRRLRSVEDLFLGPVKQQQMPEAVRLQLRMLDTFDTGKFVQLLLDLGCTAVELAAFDSGNGDMFYVDTSLNYYRERSDADFRWLPEAGLRFAGEQVVITGTIGDYSSTALRKRIALEGGKVLRVISSKVTLVVVGKGPEASTLSEARELGLRMIDEEQLMAVLADDSALARPEKTPPPPNAPILAYRIRELSPAKDSVPFPEIQRRQLKSLLESNGYLTDAWYNLKLKEHRKRRPELVEQFAQYRRGSDIPAQARLSLAPQSALCFWMLFEEHGVQITRHAPYVHEADSMGYGHALASIAQRAHLPLQDITYGLRPGSSDRYDLGCTLNGKDYQVSFKYSADNYPAPFLRLLQEMLSESADWAFLFNFLPGQKNYALLPRSLAEGLAQHGLLEPLYEVKF